MLPNPKEFVKHHQSDIFLTICIILITLISFGIGQLTAFQANQEPIIIQEPSASIQQSLTETNQTQETREEKFVGSVNSNKYHWPNCPWAKKIAPQNQIWFSSEEEARVAGYIRCSSFEKYEP
jgi:hypothetical protein